MPLKTHFVNYSTGQATSKQHKVAQTDQTGKSCSGKLRIGDVMEKTTESPRILNSTPKPCTSPVSENKKTREKTKTAVGSCSHAANHATFAESLAKFQFHPSVYSR